MNGASGPKTWHWIIFIAVVLTLTALVVPAIFKWQRARRRQIVHLELANLGNVRSRYALYASDPANSLTFHFLLNGAPLPEQTITLATASPTPRTRPTASGGQGAGQTPSAQRTLSSTAQTGGLVAGLLSTVGRLLPASLSRPLLNLSADIRKGQQMATHAKQASQYAGKLQSRGKGPGKPTTRASASLPSAAPTIIEIWSHTQFIEPNQKTFIDLSILPAKPYQYGYYTYTLKSRSVDHKEAPITMETCSLQVEPLSPFERYAPFLALTASLIILLILFLSLW